MAAAFTFVLPRATLHVVTPTIGVLALPYEQPRATRVRAIDMAAVAGGPGALRATPEVSGGYGLVRGAQQSAPPAAATTVKVSSSSVCGQSSCAAACAIAPDQGALMQQVLLPILEQPSSHNVLKVVLCDKRQFWMDVNVVSPPHYDNQKQELRVTLFLNANTSGTFASLHPRWVHRGLGALRDAKQLCNVVKLRNLAWTRSLIPTTGSATSLAPALNAYVSPTADSPKTVDLVVTSTSTRPVLASVTVTNPDGSTLALVSPATNPFQMLVTTVSTQTIQTSGVSCPTFFYITVSAPAYTSGTTFYSC